MNFAMNSNKLPCSRFDRSDMAYCARICKVPFGEQTIAVLYILPSGVRSGMDPEQRSAMRQFIISAAYTSKQPNARLFCSRREHPHGLTLAVLGVVWLTECVPDRFSVNRKVYMSIRRVKAFLNELSAKVESTIKFFTHRQHYKIGFARRAFSACCLENHVACMCNVTGFVTTNSSQLDQREIKRLEGRRSRGGHGA
jgi:hypothetical protein